VVLGTADLDELLRWAPAAAFVLTPSPTHRPIVQRLLEADVDVLVEKPATPRSDETRALAELADARGRVLMVGFNRRYAPLHIRARELWGGRATGQCLLQKHRAQAAHADLLSNFIDDTIHLVDLLRFFCGEAEAVSTIARREGGWLVGAASLVALQKGGHGIVATSLEAGAWHERYALHGASASLEVDAFSRARLVEGIEQRVLEEDYAAGWKPTLEARGFPQQIAHFFDCIRTRSMPLTSAWDSVRTQVLLEGMVSCVRTAADPCLL
jgi:virulence factor